jgi:hypothetical protein
VTDIHDNELPAFVHSLDSHQRVVLQRVVGEFLSSFPAPGDEPHPDHLPLLRQGAHTLFALMALLRGFENDDDDSDVRPWSLRIPAPGQVVLVLNRRILSWPGLYAATAHDWVHSVKVGRLTVDLRDLHDIPSTLIAWLVNLAQQVPEGRIHLIHVAPLLCRSLRILRLDALLTIEPDKP